MLDWLKKWITGAIALCALAALAWWFMQQTSSYQTLEATIRSHPAVSAQLGRVTQVKLPFFGYGFDWTDAKVNPKFSVHVIGARGEATVHAEFQSGRITNAWMATTGGTMPLVQPD